MPFSIRFSDANFPERLEFRASRFEGPSLRWTPFGMPRLNDIFFSTVFFLFGTDPKTGDLRGPMGTGVIVSRPRSDAPPHTEAPSMHIYAVTAQHVATAGASIIRINTEDGKSRYIHLEPHEWDFIAGGDDLAVADITERLQQGDLVFCVPEDLFATPDFISDYDVNIGEDCFMLGLFAEHPGTHKNLVAARFGNLSLSANEDAPIEQPNDAIRPSHIIDMHSRPGFSGSPAFVYRTPSGDLRFASQGPRVRLPKVRNVITAYGGRGTLQPDTEDWHEYLHERENTFLRLLGIHVGQYPETVVARRGRRENSDDVIRDRDKLQIPSSMTIVVPAWQISRVLNLRKFRDKAMQREEEMRKRDEERNKPIPESASSTQAEAADANPSHKEDFTALLGEAAQSQKQGD